MAAEPLQAASFKRFEQQGDQYFVQCELREDPDNFEESAIDLTVSTLRQSWHAPGLRKTNKKHANALMRIYGALTSADGAATDGADYRVLFKPKGASLQVQCQWREPGGAHFLTHPAFELAEETSGDGAIAAVIDALLQEIDVLKASNREHKAVSSELQARCEKLQQQVDRFVQDRSARDAQLFAEFAAIINEQKEMTRSLQAELAAARGGAAAGEGIKEEASGGIPAPLSPEASAARGRGAPADDEEEYKTTGSDEED